MRDYLVVTIVLLTVYAITIGLSLHTIFVEVSREVYHVDYCGVVDVTNIGPGYYSVLSKLPVEVELVDAKGFASKYRTNFTAYVTRESTMRVYLFNRCSENITVVEYAVIRPYAYLAVPSFLAGVLSAAFILLLAVRRFSQG